MAADRLAALRSEREAVRDFCRNLSEAEWDTPSEAAGWRVRDVIAHLGATSKAFFTPDLLKILRSKQIERTNDAAVDTQSDRTSEQLLSGYCAWSGRATTLLRFGTVGPMGALRLPIGELGYYPMRLMPSTALFDWHVHLRHDIAPALGRPAPPTDEPRMSAVVEWALALLERSHQQQLSWVHDPLTLTLDGLGGGTWRVEPTGRPGRLRVVPSDGSDAAAHITGKSEEFPAWVTTRRSWRDSAVVITGDSDLGAKVLDSINLI